LFLFDLTALDLGGTWTLAPLCVLVRIERKFGDVVNLSKSDKCGHSITAKSSPNGRYCPYENFKVKSTNSV